MMNNTPNKRVFFLLALVGVGFIFPWQTFGIIQPGVEPLPEPKQFAYGRVEVPETSLGYGSVEMPKDATCRVTGKDSFNRDTSYTYSSNTAVCVLDALSKEDGFSYALRFYSPWKALLTSLEKDGTKYESSIWFAINNDLSPSENCDDLIGVSLTSCTLENNDELLIFYDDSSFYPILKIVEAPGQTYEVSKEATFTIQTAESDAGVSGAMLVCGNNTAMSDILGKAVIRLTAEGKTECYAQKSEYIRSRRVEITVNKGEDEDPPNEEEPNDGEDDTPNDNPQDSPTDSTDDPPSNPSPTDNTQTPPEEDDPVSDTPNNDNPSQPQTPAGNSPSEETPNGNAPQNEKSVKVISEHQRRESALRGLKYLSRRQKADGLIADELLSSWASMAFASYGRPPFDVHHAGPSLDHALWHVDVRGMDSLSLSRHILGLAASNHNLTAVNNVHLCAELKKGWNGKTFGDPTLLNDDIFGLLAARACNDSGLTILLRVTVKEGQNADGGYGITFKGKSNVDITAAAIQSLAGSGVNMSAGRDYLKNQQNTDGGFPYQRGAFSNTASTAWVLGALTVLGEDPHAWNKGEESPWSYLLTNQTASGAFRWTAGENDDVLMTTYAVTGLLGAPWPVMGAFSEVPDYHKEEGVTEKVKTSSASVVKKEPSSSAKEEVEQKKNEETFFSDGIISSVAAEDRYQDSARVLGAVAPEKTRDALDIVLLVALAVVLESLLFWTRRAISVR